MEIKITTDHLLKVLQVLSWIIFIGLCVEAGGIIFNTFYTFFINPINTYAFWEGANLAELYQFDHGHFLIIALIMTIVALLKAILFYLIVKLFTEKKLNISQPFSADLRRFILNIAYLAIGISFFCQYGFKYFSWLTEQGVKIADLQSLHIAGADVWLFMAVILFIIAQIFKRGIEIQAENELTI